MDPERFSPVDGSSPPLFSLLQKEIDHRFLPRKFLRFRRLVLHQRFICLPLRVGMDSQGVGSSHFRGEQRLEWTSKDVVAGPGLCQPCFACPPVGVALGTVCGASDRSPVVNPNDLFSWCRFRHQAQVAIS
ncbi:hypothetical protein YC2023_116859 [Brassica napus]